MYEEVGGMARVLTGSTLGIEFMWKKGWSSISSNVGLEVGSE